MVIRVRYLNMNISISMAVGIGLFLAAICLAPPTLGQPGGDIARSPAPQGQSSTSAADSPSAKPAGAIVPAPTSASAAGSPGSASPVPPHAISFETDVAQRQSDVPEGPLQRERRIVWSHIRTAKLYGIGTTGYEREFDAIQKALLNGDPIEPLRLRLYKLSHILDGQFAEARVLKTYEPAGALNGRKLPSHVVPDPLALQRSARLAKAIVGFGLRSSVTEKVIDETLKDHPDTLMDTAYDLQNKLNALGHTEFRVIFGAGYISIKNTLTSEEVKLVDL